MPRNEGSDVITVYFRSDSPALLPAWEIHSMVLPQGSLRTVVDSELAVVGRSVAATTNLYWLERGREKYALKASMKSLAKMQAAIVSGTSADGSVTVSYLGHEALRTNTTLDVEFNGSFIAITGLDSDDGAISSELGDAVWDACVWVATRCDPSSLYGYLGGYGLGESPLAVGLAPAGVVSQYSWIVLLTVEAVARLGGVDQVTAIAPVERCLPIEGEKGVSLLCRVAPQPADASLEAWTAWRSFLAPVLRIGRWDDMPLSFRRPWILEEDWYRCRPHNGQGVPVEYDRSMFQPGDPYLDL